MKRIVYISLCVWFFTACSSDENRAPKTGSASGNKTDSTAVFIAKKDSIEKTVLLPGDLLPNEQVEIRAKIQGYLKKLNVDIGSIVHKGQLLGLIDAPEINTRISEVSEKIQSAKAKFAASKDTYDRIYEASQTAGVIATTELEKARNQMLADSAEYRAASYNASTNRQIGNYLAIASPFNGVVTKRNVNVGAFVGNPTDLPILIIDDISKLRLQVAVPETYAGAVLKGNNIKFTTKGIPEKVFTGKLVRRSESIDNGSRSEIWEFEVINSDKLLKTGMYTDAKLVLRRTQPGILVPSSALVTTLEKKFVIKIHNGRSEWMDVNQGLNLEDKIEIFGNVRPGDTLVLKANEELKPDIKVIAKLIK